MKDLDRAAAGRRSRYLSGQLGPRRMFSFYQPSPPRSPRPHWHLNPLLPRPRPRPPGRIHCWTNHTLPARSYLIICRWRSPRSPPAPQELLGFMAANCTEFLNELTQFSAVAFTTVVDKVQNKIALSKRNHFVAWYLNRSVCRLNGR